MLIKVKTLAGRTHQLEVEATTTVLQIKEMLFGKEGVNVEQFSLVFNGHQLAVTETVESAKFTVDGLIMMVAYFRGGGEPVVRCDKDVVA